MLRTRFLGLAAFARRNIGRVRHRLRVVYLRLPLVRRRLSRRAVAAWSEGQTIVFVCLGNICRSPFAEMLTYQAVGDDKIVRSAGYFPEPGRPAPPEAVESARAWGVDLTAHRSRVLTAELVEDADAIFVFDDRNYRHVVSSHPGARRKVHYTGSLAAGGPVAIEDPLGRSATEFERIYRLIAHSVDATRQQGDGVTSAPRA